MHLAMVMHKKIAKDAASTNVKEMKFLISYFPFIANMSVRITEINMKI